MLKGFPVSIKILVFVKNVLKKGKISKTKLHKEFKRYRSLFKKLTRTNKLECTAGI